MKTKKMDCRVWSPVEGEDWEEFVGFCAKFYQDRRRAELYVHCGKRTWRVHKSIIASACPLLHQAALSSDQGAELLGSQVPSAVHALLRFLTTLDYDDCEFDESEYDDSGEVSPLMQNVYVHALATELRVPALAALATTKFMKLAETGYPRRDFARAIKEAYDEPYYEHTKMLREKILDLCAVTSAIRNNILVPREETNPLTFMDISRLWELAREVPQFKAELAERFENGPTTVFKEVPASTNKRQRSSVAESSSSIQPARKKQTKSAPAPQRQSEIRKRFRCRHCSGKFTAELWITGKRRQRRVIWCPFCGRTQNTAQWAECQIALEDHSGKQEADGRDKDDAAEEEEAEDTVIKQEGDMKIENEPVSEDEMEAKQEGEVKIKLEYEDEDDEGSEDGEIVE